VSRVSRVSNCHKLNFLICKLKNQPLEMSQIFEENKGVVGKIKVIVSDKNIYSVRDGEFFVNNSKLQIDSTIYNFCMLDSQKVIFCIKNNDTHYLQIFDLQALSIVSTVSLLNREINRIYFINKLFICYNDCIQIVNIDNFGVMIVSHTIYHHRDIDDMTVCNSGKYLSYYSINDCFIFSIQKLKLIKIYNNVNIKHCHEICRTKISCITFTPDSKELIIFGNGSNIEFFDIDIGYVREECKAMNCNSVVWLNSSLLLCNNKNEVECMQIYKIRWLWKKEIGDHILIGQNRDNIFYTNKNYVDSFSIKREKHDYFTDTLSHFTKMNTFDDNLLCKIFDYY
jgi:hypothetical protein